MRSNLVALALVGALSVPLPGLAGPLGTHAVRGVVKLVTATCLVITRSGKEGAEMTFVLTEATEREGAVTVGSRVSIRYIKQGNTLVATAVASDP